MSSLITFIAVLAVLAAVHIAVMAAVADAFGVTVREVVLGWGPVIWSSGKWTLKALPFGGSVQLRDTRLEAAGLSDADNPSDALNLKPRCVQAIIPLSGPLALLILAVCVRGGDALGSTSAGFRQFLEGAVDHDVAHQLLRRLGELIQYGFWPLLGVAAAKIAAFNLLPLPTLNGGQAIISLVLGPLRTTPQWLDKLQISAAWAYVLFGLLWLAAIVSYL
ncbi:site-2 protease family protein [Variovorax sp. RT4R15]|uniref:site-2 protease family protein n=1 Tax=Variovorax sp. RT4R15 TaxID=3443737 RepID=UPI003F44FDAD